MQPAVYAHVCSVHFMPLPGCHCIEEPALFALDKLAQKFRLIEVEVVSVGKG